MHRIVIIIVIISLSFSLKGQDRTDFFYYDSLTYSQYNEGNWKILSRSGLLAVKLGHDYYYMRMRVGISFYERGKYLLAMSHFRRALEFNTGDQIALEYIYYCYLFTGQSWTAGSLSKDFGDTLRKRSGVDKATKNRMSVDYLYNKSDSRDIIDSYLAINGFIDPGNLIIPVSFYNIGVNLSHTVAPGTGIVHSLSYLHRENSLFTFDGSQGYPDYPQDVSQLQYFFSLHFGNRKGLLFSPSVFYLHTRYPLIYFSNGGMPPGAYTYTEAENNIGAGLSLTKNRGIISISGSTCISRLGFRNHFQAGADLMLYPLGNNNLYFGCGYNFKSSETQSERETGYVSEAKLGFFLGGKVYLDFAGLFGNIDNFIDSNGQIVYNGINEISQVLKADISIPFGKSGVVLYLGTRLTSEYTAHVPVDYIYSTTSEKDFYSTSLIGGLSWKF